MGRHFVIGPGISLCLFLISFSALSALQMTASAVYSDDTIPLNDEGTVTEKGQTVIPDSLRNDCSLPAGWIHAWIVSGRLGSTIIAIRVQWLGLLPLASQHNNDWLHAERLVWAFTAPNCPSARSTMPNLLPNYYLIDIEWPFYAVAVEWVARTDNRMRPYCGSGWGLVTDSRFSGWQTGQLGGHCREQIMEEVNGGPRQGRNVGNWSPDWSWWKLAEISCANRGRRVQTCSEYVMMLTDKCTGYLPIMACWWCCIIGIVTFCYTLAIKIPLFLNKKVLTAES